LRVLREMPDSELDYAESLPLSEETARRLIDFEFPADEQARIHELMARDADGLSPEEKLELEQFLYIEHILVILRARAILLLDRPRDPQRVVEIGMREPAEGNAALYEEVLRWHDEQFENPTLTVEDLIATAIDAGEIIHGINDSEALKDLKIVGRSIADGSTFTHEQTRLLIDRWASRRAK
jgi:hypothetical protein